MASPRATSPSDPLIAAIEEAAGLLASIWNRETEELPTSATQLHVLMIIEQHRDINLSGLAGQLGALASSASRLCDRLQAGGFLHPAHRPSRPDRAGRRAQPVPGGGGRHERLRPSGSGAVRTGLDKGGFRHGPR